MTKSVSNTQRAAAALREMIFRGDLAPGSDHLENELAQTLQMSRTPVREAALILEAQGLIALRPRKGIRILPISPKDMDEIYDVLTELESLAARNAAERNQSDDSLAPLNQAIAEMQSALDRNALDDWAAADDCFHAALVDLGGNSRIRAIFDMMNDQVRRARYATLYMRPLPTQSNADHEDLLNAIRAGRPEEAVTLHRAHRQTAKKIIIGLLEKYRLHHL